MRYLPTRIVHVGSSTRKPHLHILERQQNVRYIALSHCWGKIYQFRTTKANFEQHKQEIIFESLSKTFQEALLVTRRLGIEHIWIDSLCIIQDDENDWLRESEGMGSIYANAYITVAETSAADGNGGLDGVRPPINWLKFPFHGNDESKGYTWFTDGSWTTHNDLDGAPLSKRGWVFQERTLSRRIIHFASSQVYWECKRRFVGEDTEDVIPDRDVTLVPSTFWARMNAVPHVGPLPVERSNNLRDLRHALLQQHPHMPFYWFWEEFICYYCTWEFTRMSDRLIALLGIIQVVEKLKGLRCIDGHWDDGSWLFVRGLMWISKQPRTMPGPDGDKQSRLCSSWSWASLEGSVQYDYVDIALWEEHGLKDCDLHLTAIEDKVHVPWPSHPLKVLGMLRTVYKGECKQEYLGRKYMLVTKSELSRRIDGRVYFDREDEEPEQFYFSPVHHSPTTIPCLALVERHRPGSRARYFERVGVGYVNFNREDGSPGADMSLFETCERETYYII